MERREAPTRAKKQFQDSSSGSFTIGSSWNSVKQKGKKSAENQTPPEFYEFMERETQTGVRSIILGGQVAEKNKGRTLLTYICSHYKREKKSEDFWRAAILDGHLTVDGSIMTNPDHKVDFEEYIEYIGTKSNTCTQTQSTAAENLSEESKGEDSQITVDLLRFLRHAAPLVQDELEKNATNKNTSLFDFGDNFSSAAEDTQDAITYWKTLSVDLDLRGVVFRDWTGTNYYPASISKCTVTRNKERIYDVEYKDGSTQQGVKEEYIHVLGDLSSNKNRPQLNAAQLKEGMRVHAKVTLKNGVVKYMPGLITKYTSNRNARTGGLFEVQCDGRSRAEVDLTVDDILVGLSTGLSIEARMPRKVSLQCTGLSWNATGNILAAAYGKNDVDGWCDFPGAVCCWSVFGKQLVPDNPDFVLDHPSSLMCVQYHPVIPSILAAGSFNGEIVVWDLTNPESPLAVSSITEYSHQTPVLSLNWVCSSVGAQASSSGAGSGDLDSWLVSSVCTGGKALFWSLKNKLAHPVKGATLPKGKARSLPGATAAAFASSNRGSGSASSRLSSAPKWMITGLQGGGILRSQFHRMLGGPTLSQESFKTYPPIDEVFLQLRSDDAYAYQANDGAVTSVQFSPFHRNLFLLSGTDGTVKLFHLLEKGPIRSWEPTPPPGSSGVSGTFSPISAASFSPIRPLVFAATSSDGFLYLYDLGANSLSPVAVLECPLQPPVSAEDAAREAARGGSKKPAHKKSSGGDSTHNRVTVTGLAFNPKQRGLIAACDYLGRVHIWKLSWKLSNIKADEQSALDAIASIYSSDEGR